MKPQLPKNWKRRTLEALTVFSLLTVAAWALTATIHMTAPVSQKAYALYADESLQQQITAPWDWAPYLAAPLTEGANIYVWILNTGNINLNLAISVENATCTISVSPATMTDLTPTESRSFTLTFTNLPAASTISWDLRINY